MLSKPPNSIRPPERVVPEAQAWGLGRAPRVTEGAAGTTSLKITPIDMTEATPVAMRPKRSFGHYLALGTRGVLQIVLPVALVAGALMTTQRLIATAPPVPQRPQQEIVYPVETTVATVAAQAARVRLFGDVVAGRTVDLRVQATGEVMAIHPRLAVGAAVKAGETLVEIDRFQFEGAVREARANLAEAEAKRLEAETKITQEREQLAFAEEQLRIAERDMARAEQLRSTGAASVSQLETVGLVRSQRAALVAQRRSSLALEETRLTQQKAAIERLQWRLAQAERTLAQTVLVAPFDGVVQTTTAERGRVLNASDAAVSLYAVDGLDVRLTIPDRLYASIVSESGSVIGRQVEVVWALGAAESRYTATIERLRPSIAAARGGVEVYARIAPNPDAPILRPGAFVSVFVSGATIADAVRVPETALYGGDHVFVIENGRMARRAVTLEGAVDRDVLVRGEIKTGDRVVVTRIAEAGEGVAVSERSAPTPAAAQPVAVPEAKP